MKSKSVILIFDEAKEELNIIIGNERYYQQKDRKRLSKNSWRILHLWMLGGWFRKGE